MFVRGQPAEPSRVINWKLEDGRYAVREGNGIDHYYEYDEWHKKQAALVAELSREDITEVVTFIDIGDDDGGNEEPGEAELNEEKKIEEEEGELRENRETGYMMITELKGMEEVGVETKDEIGEENADQWRELDEAREEVKLMYEGGGEEQKYLKAVEVFEYLEEEVIYEEEIIKGEKLEFAEDRTEYGPNGDNSESTTESQDYDEMVLKTEIYVRVYDSIHEPNGHADPSTKKENNDAEERKEYDKRGARRFNEVMDKVGQEKVKEILEFRKSDIQEKTKMANVEVKERERLQHRMQDVKKMGEGKKDERTEKGEERKHTEVEKFEYGETGEKVESTMEALEIGLEEMRYDDKNTDGMHLNGKRLITETIMKNVLSGRYARDAPYTYQLGEYTQGGLGENYPSGYSTKEGVAFPGQAVNEKNGKEEEANANVGERDPEETVEVGQSIEINQKAEHEEPKRKPVSTEAKNQKESGRAQVDVKDGKKTKKYNFSDDNMKYRPKGEHKYDTKDRPQGNYYTKIKLSGTIGVYHYRRVKSPGHEAKYWEES
jgi:hypothetical protein